MSIANVARFYDPENGRFVSQDSYRGEQDEPGTWHLYTYCANDPVNFVDPSGHAFVRTYTRNQCQNTYRLLRAIDMNMLAIDALTFGKTFVKIGIKKLKKIKYLKRAIKGIMVHIGMPNLVTQILSRPGWLYGKFKKGFERGGWGYNKVAGFRRTGKKARNKVKYTKYEPIERTRFVAYSPWNFSFYYSSKSKKNVKG